MNEEYNEIIATIQQEIITNGNNEITGAILSVILQAMTTFVPHVTGYLEDLNTTDKSNLVAAINEIQGLINNDAEVSVFSGTADPNLTPPPLYDTGDMYSRIDGSNNPIGFYIFNGSVWYDLYNHQNIEALYLDYSLNDNIEATVENVVSALNSDTNIVGSNPVVILPSDSPVILYVTEYLPSSQKVHVFLFKGGEGVYGFENTPFTNNNLRKISVLIVTLDDIDNDANTVSIDLGTILEANFLTELNSVSRDVSDPSKVYYILYNYDDSGTIKTKSYKLLNEYKGIHGGGSNDFTLDMFTEAASSDTSGQNLQQTLINGAQAVISGQDVDIETDQDFNFTAAGEFHINAEEGQTYDHAGKYASDISSELITDRHIPDIGKVKNLINDTNKLTNDFIIAVSNVDGFGQMCDEVRYFTDAEHKIFLNDYLPTGVKLDPTLDQTIQNVVLDDDGDLIFMCKNSTLTVLGSPVLFMKFVGCRIENNLLVWDSVIYNDIFVVPQRLHNLIYSDGFLYAATRNNSSPSTVGTIPIRVFKINAYDFTDVTPLDLTADASYVTITALEIEVYKNKVYVLGGTSAGTQIMVEVDKSLKTSRKLIDTGANNLLRGISGYPFLIYNDLIYLPITNRTGGTTTQNTAGIAIYNLNGQFIRSNFYLDTGTSSTKTFIPHWINVFNNKLIITPSGGESTNNKNMYRVDAETLLLEDAYPCNHVITNNNSITSDGFIILNEEYIGTGATVKKIKYNDFSNVTTLFNNFSSSGSLDVVPLTEAAIDPLFYNYEPKITATTSADYYAGDKTFKPLNKAAVGLSNVDNTSDVNKPVSTAQAAADALKANETDVVHKAGTETITGTKTISNIMTDASNGFRIVGTDNTRRIYVAPTGMQVILQNGGTLSPNGRTLQIVGQTTVSDVPTNPTDVVRYIDLQASTSNYDAKTAAYTLTASNYVVVLSSGSATFTLPTGITGKVFFIKNVGTGVLTISGTIDGNASVTLSEGSSIAIQCVGTTYILLASYSKTFAVNTTLTGLSSATLNSTYPNVPVGFRVICGSIMLGGAIYTKYSENGTSDVWVMTSAPVQV